MRPRTHHLRTLLAAALAALSLAACGNPAPPPAAARHATATGACHLHGTGIYALPDTTPACTPGAWIDTLPTDQAAARKLVCHHGYNPRPGVTVTGPLKRKALALYGMPASASPTVELDHRYPVWLGGKTTLANLWPELNAPPNTYADPFEHNPKDVLEIDPKVGLYARVCKFKTMTPQTARAVFDDPDWVTELHKYSPGTANRALK